MPRTRLIDDMPESVRPSLRRLARRLAIGLFLDVWPAWAIASLLVAGSAALVCRLFFAGAASWLPWLWLAPLLAAVPALVIAFVRAYRPAEVVADRRLAGRRSRHAADAARDERSRVGRVAAARARLDASRCRGCVRGAGWRRCRRRLAFLACALWLPQRAPAPARTPRSPTRSSPISRRRWRS